MRVVLEPDQIESRGVAIQLIVRLAGRAASQLAQVLIHLLRDRDAARRYIAGLRHESPAELFLQSKIPRFGVVPAKMRFERIGAEPGRQGDKALADIGDGDRGYALLQDRKSTR